jgi:hypothetical protein
LLPNIFYWLSESDIHLIVKIGNTVRHNSICCFNIKNHGVSSFYFDKRLLWFLVVNGERASYKAPGFAPKISRTRSVLLYDLAERFSK